MPTTELETDLDPYSKGYVVFMKLIELKKFNAQNSIDISELLDKTFGQGRDRKSTEVLKNIIRSRRGHFNITIKKGNTDIVVSLFRIKIPNKKYSKESKLFIQLGEFCTGFTKDENLYVPNVEVKKEDLLKFLEENDFQTFFNAQVSPNTKNCIRDKIFEDPFKNPLVADAEKTRKRTIISLKNE